MTDNNIILLNDIILKIYTTKDFEEMRKSVLSSLRFFIPNTGSVFYLASKDEPYKLTGRLGIGTPEKILDLYLKDFQEYDKTIWQYSTPVAKAYNDSAFIQNEANQKTEFYQKIYAPQKIFYQATLTIIHDGIFLGIIAVFRTKDEGDFLQDELFKLELLAVHLGVRLYQNFNTFTIIKDHRPDLETLQNFYHLTLRESEVFYSIMNENKNIEICRNLCISQNTLKKHLMNIYKKLNVNSRIELFQLANITYSREK